MELARSTVARLALAGMVVAVAVTGCANTPAPGPSPSPSFPTPASSPSATSTPSPAQPTDYSALLISLSDIGPGFTTLQPPVLNPNGSTGVAQLFTSVDGSRRLADTILIADSPTRAAAVLDRIKDHSAAQVTGALQPADVGVNGSTVSGIAPDHSQAVTMVLFTEGRTVVNLTFESAPDDPVESDYVLDVARKQDATIQSGFPS